MVGRHKFQVWIFFNSITEGFKIKIMSLFIHQVLISTHANYIICFPEYDSHHYLITCFHIKRNALMWLTVHQSVPLVYFIMHLNFEK